MSTEHKSVQTEGQDPFDETALCGPKEEDRTALLPAEDRSVEECLKIYKSEVKKIQLVF
jgi:hypothetical protein